MNIHRFRRTIVQRLGAALLLAATAGLGGCGAADPVCPKAPDGAPAQGATPAKGAAATGDPLLSLNEAARAAYRDTRAEMLRRAGPILVVGPDQLTLLRGDKRETADALPPVYHDLKMVSHIALGLHSLLFGQDGPLASALVARLRAFRDLMGKAGAAVEQRGLAPAMLDRQRRLIPQASAFVDGVLSRGAVKPAELVAFERALEPLLRASVEDAARAQLDWLHARVTAFRATLSEGEWRALHVVVIGGHQPRDGSVAMQYFTRLLGEPMEGRRIIYAEGLWKTDAALELLGTHLIDASLAEGFFSDPMRLHRDLLGEAAAAYLPSLLPATSATSATGASGKGATPSPSP